MSDQAGEGFEHTELERALVNWMVLRGFGRPDVGGGRPVRSLFLMERENHGMEAYRWSWRVGQELTTGVDGSRPVRPPL